MSTRQMPTKASNALENITEHLVNVRIHSILISIISISFNSSVRKYGNHRYFKLYVR